MNNKEIRQFEENVIDLFNASPLEIEVKRLIAENVMYKLSHEADKIIVMEIQQEVSDAESL